jgi:hypothetical protein
MVIFPIVQYGYGFSDWVDCFLTIGQHETHFAAGYNERAFSKIRAGMTTNQVLRILGEPLDRSTWSQWPEGEWEYSRPASSSGHYHLRAVRFATNGLVSEANKMFYFD